MASKYLRRIVVAFHVLRGRPVVHGCTLHGIQLSPDTKNAYIANNSFSGYSGTSVTYQSQKDK